MGDAMALTRRTILLSYVACRAVQVIPFLGIVGSVGREDWPLLSRLHFPPELVVFGRYCWQTISDLHGISLDNLHEALAARLCTATSDDVSDLGDAIRRSVADDFRAGRTVEVEGWYLAETEIILGALAAQAFL